PLAPDINKLVKAGKVSANWDKDSYGGFVTNSVVVLAVRKGNPKHIRTWDDLVKPGVEVITANPFSSGGGRWNVMAAYGAQLEQGKTKQQALAYLSQLFKNVPVQDKSARDSLQTFVGGKGDVMLAYENEAITAQQKGEDVDYVVPDQTILIENPVAVTNDGGEAGKALVDYLRTAPAQKIFGQKGYRPVVKSVVDTFQFAQPSGLFTIDKVVGGDEVMSKFFDRYHGLVGK